MKKRPGETLRAAREARQWKLIDLSRLSGISASRLSALENEYRAASDSEWELLCSWLELPRQPARRLTLPAAPKLWLMPDPRLEENPLHPAAHRVAAARRTFGADLVETLRLVDGRHDRALCWEFLEQARLDSGHEAFFWLRLMAAGAVPYRAAPTRVGFRDLPVIAPASKLIVGDCRHPCLMVELGAGRCLLFPQLTLDTGPARYRLDALVCRQGQGGRRWVDVEVDGLGHDPRFDRERQARLRLPTVRLTQKELLAEDLLGVLAERIHFALGLADAS